MKPCTLLLPACIIIGCSGSGESTQPAGEGIQEGKIRAFEADFLPSDHDPEDALPPSLSQPSRDTLGSSQTGNQNVSLEEMVQGFRVQLYSTTIIDSAKARLNRVEAAFPGEWFYLEYDQPSYKIRGGNFLSRYEADRFAKQLIDKGFRNAWAVPQRVFKNPPPPPR
jgi:hypothetical protein